MRAADDRRDATSESRIVAVLGPTNTGKTHLAIERMLGHASGMIGFPLRLLARENYDKIARLKGRAAVALITGEERILPPRPAYIVCTVESMPLDRPVAFLAIDEIQMAADRERGHVFTDRLLHARGLDETMFLGAETAKPLIRKLVPRAEFVSRPRFSQLSYTGPKKITRLPRRAAVVAFSAAEVYGIAELVRRQRGGAAVVFGALSPRTRNAQVAMYQAGEVDYLVATDAIGMGLNMDIDHVAFAQLAKFDGHGMRRLQPNELAQIAGRAGRHMNDGTFGTTAEVGPLDAQTIEAIENHRFPALRALTWRNDQLDFSSVSALIGSLERPPPMPELLRKRDADDHMTLLALSRDADIMALAQGRQALALLWEVCQIPDFRKTMSESHARLVGQIYRHLRGPQRRLPTDWVAAQIDRLDRTEGDIDALLARIAHIRTWTYVSHRPQWLEDAGGWQERSRAVEDRLSDALHERLTQRFVDRRAAVLARRLREGDGLLSSVTATGEVLVEGQYAGQLAGFDFVADPDARDGARAVLAAANKALRADVGARVRRLETAGDEAFALDPAGYVTWEGHRVARLGPGDHALAPRVEILPSDLLEPGHREAVRRRISACMVRRIESELPALARLSAAALTGPARGLAWEVASALGTVPATTVQDLTRALSPADHGALRALGLTLGGTMVFLRKQYAPAAIALRAILWGVATATLPPPPPRGQLSIPAEGLPIAFLAACGYGRAGPLAIRADRLERFAAALAEAATAGPFVPTQEMRLLTGARAEDLPAVLRDLGYRPLAEAPAPAVEGGEAPPAEIRYVPRALRRHRPERRRPAPRDHASPFAGLTRLVPRR